MKTLGDLLAVKAGYKYQVFFDKHFVGGALKGVKCNDFLRFTCWHDANDFCQSCDGKTVVKPCAGSPYTKHAAFIEAIA